MDKPKTTPKDFFFSIAAMATLYVSAGSLLALLFAIMNAIFPDPLAYGYGYYGGYSGGIRFAIASLIIVFPLYLTLSWLIRKDTVTHPEKKELAVRKWLVYLTLFVTGAVIVGDLIALLNTFLGGEITARFIAKVISVLVVAKAIFWYYFYDLRRSAEENKKASRALVAGASLFVLAVLVWGFTVMGSPATARALRFDDRRLSDLQNIQWQVVNYWQQKGALPSALEETKDSIGGSYIPVDPETGDAYGYNRTGTLSFEICAAFALSSDEKESVRGVPAERSLAYPVYPGGIEENWEHPAGEHCFSRTIDPDRYPVFEKPIR